MTREYKTGGRKSANITHCIDCSEDLELSPVFKAGYRQSRCRIIWIELHGTRD